MTKTRTLFYSVVVFGVRTEVAVNVFESFFWLLDVMQQLSWEILLDEAVKEGKNHKRGNTRMSGTPRLWVWGDRAAGEQAQAATLLASKQWAVFVKYTGVWLDMILFLMPQCILVSSQQAQKYISVMLTDVPHLTWKTCSYTSVNTSWS